MSGIDGAPSGEAAPTLHFVVDERKPSALASPLPHNEKLYGRRDETSFLTHALERISKVGSRSESVILQGPAGSGKRAVADQLRIPVTKAGGCFCVGQFNSMRQNLPNAVIVTLLNNICTFLLETEDDLESVRRDLETQLGGDACFLKGILPNLASLLDVDEVDSIVGCKVQSFLRLQGACRRFLKAVATANRPIVLIFEELGYADQGSMQVISSLMTDLRSKNVLIVGTCRSAKVCASLLPGGRLQWGVNVVELPGLLVDAVTWIVADLLKKPYIKLGECANYIVQKTNGNAFHVLQLIQYLEKVGMFVGSDKEEWKFDMSLIQRTANGPVDLGSSLSLLQYTIDNLTEETKEALKIAACMGSCSDVSLFKDVTLMNLDELSRNGKYRLDIAGVDRILAVSVEEGLLEIGCRGKFKFVNDMVQAAFLKMIPDTMLLYYHRAVGNRALTKAKTRGQASSNNERSCLMFSAIDHLNRTKSLTTNRAQRVAMAKYNLDAATRGMPKCAFLFAINFLKNALDWLGGGSWSAEYELTRAINNTLAQAYFGCGESAKSQKTVDLISENALSFGDKLEASFTLISSLSAQGKLEAAINLCVALLQGLGEKFPRKISKTRMSFEMMKTKQKLKGMSDSAILLIPQMTDQKIIYTVQLIMEIEHQAFFLQQKEVWSMATLRALQLTLAHGRADKTPYVFASYGMLHAHLGNNKKAYRFGELAMKLTDITSEKSSMVQTTCTAAFFCLHWERNLQELVEPLTRACQVGNAYGDIEWAILNGATFIAVSLACGRHLFEVEDEARAMCQGMALYTAHEHSLRICLPLWQCASNLSTRGISALDLTGDAMNQEELIEICTKTKNLIALGTIWATRLQLACYFQNWAVALKMIEKLQNSRDFQAGSFSSYFYKFFESLTYIALDRQNNSKKFQGKVTKNIKELKKLVNNGTVSCEPLVLLLEAEAASLQSKKNGLKKCYDDAIASAEARDMLNIRALANECAGNVFLNNDDYLSDQYLSEALEYYFQWGSMGKVEQLERDHHSLHSKPKVVTSVASSRGSRTNSTGRKSKCSGKGERPRKGTNGRVVLFKN